DDDLKYPYGFTPNVINAGKMHKKDEGVKTYVVNNPVNSISNKLEEPVSKEKLSSNELNDVNSIDSLEVAKKAEVRWAIEGDENTKFFNGILNNKRSQLAIHGVLVDEEVDATARTIGFTTFSTPFVHLGVKVGGVMSRINTWDDVVAKVSSRLSKWNLKTLSIDSSKLFMVKVKLLILSILFLDDVLGYISFVRWPLLVPKSFRRPPRGGVEEEQLGLLQSCIGGLILPNIPDRWVWSLEISGEFSVKYFRSLIDDSLLHKEDVATRWVKVMPIKINVFSWRVRLDKLPTLLNLSLRCMDLPSIACPLCLTSVESASQFFSACLMARQL
ncbi:RNA-directed DNA polymerase, eukaryota, partial [Tanacetum coccineum]